MADGSETKLALQEGAGVISVAPWPFRLAEVTLEWRARRLPEGARWTDEAAMRADLAAAPVQALSARLVPG
jgi:hypothetical protein